MKWTQRAAPPRPGVTPTPAITHAILMSYEWGFNSRPPSANANCEDAIASVRFQQGAIEYGKHFVWGLRDAAASL
jgi:hypothetical protein